MRRIIIFLTFTFIHLSGAGASEFVSYTTKNGLSNNYVEDIVQDHSGYLWIATRMGLNRFNGTEFKQYFSSSSDTNSLPFNNVLSLYIDANNMLWLGSYGCIIGHKKPDI